jgi:hypothetical protein
MVAQFKLGCIFSEIEENLCDLSFQEIFTILGILNGVVYSAACNEGVVSRDSNRKLKFDFRTIGNLFRPGISVSTPVKFLAEYLKQYWSGLAFYSRDAVHRIRKLISQRFKVFTQEDRSLVWSDPKQRHRSPNPCGDFNMLRALLLARACEERLLAYGWELEATQLNMEKVASGCYEFERIEEKSFPKHKAYLMVAIAEACGIWRQKDTPHPDIAGAIDIEYLRLSAERQFQDTEPGDRTDEEILRTEFLAVTETETIVSGDVAVVVEKIVDAVPLLALVRQSMLVPVRDRLPKTDGGGVSVPTWARRSGDRARKWWERQVNAHGRWLLEVAPEWFFAECI